MQSLYQRSRTQSLPYKKSSKVSKYNVIMNDLYIDCGYPQQIILTKSKQNQTQNFVQDNKKNLKNFFKDRLPADQVAKKLHQENKVQFDSLKVFQIKTQQLQLKSETKIVLNDTFLNDKDNKRANTTFSNRKMKKVQEIFSLNDKTLQFKNKFQSLNMNRLKAYNKDNHRRQTQSFMEKRTKLLKKQAYDKVFGMDSSSVSRTLPVSPVKQNDLLSIKKQEKRQIKTLYGKMMPKKKQQNLSELLSKMDDFKNKFKAVKLDYKQEQNKGNSSFDFSKSQDHTQFGHQKQKMSQNMQEKNKLLSMVQNITNFYRKQTIQEKKPNLTCIQDLKKVDPQFYNNLNQHKKSRMQKRLYELYKYSVPELEGMIESKLRTEQRGGYQGKGIHINKDKYQNLSDAFSVTDDEDMELIKGQKMISKRKVLTIGEKFRNLGKHLIKAYEQSKLFNVRHNYIYSAFWQQRQPYQMEGSYAFFKAIKINDFQCVKTFININMSYLYEQDMNGKTPLVYACFHNREEIVSYFLSLGCNVDKQCAKKKTALFYALKNKNLNISQILLQYGASPWSSDEIKTFKMIEDIKDLEVKSSFEILFSNAKKINLATRLQPTTKKRLQFWNENRNKIIHNKKIIF